jgi:accessory gene regulator B
MITQLSGKVSSFFVKQGIIEAEDNEVYAYSFEILISTFISFLALFVISVLTGTVVFTLMYLVGFIPMRVVAGGFHAKTHFRCFIILMFAYFAFLLLLTYIPFDLHVHAIVFSMAASIVSVFFIAPSEDVNKPISMDERKLFKKSSRIAIIIYTAVVCLLFLLLGDGRFAFAVALGNVTLAASLLANLIKCKVRNRNLRERYGFNETN